MAMPLPQATCEVDLAAELASEEELRQRILAAKKELGERLLILGHHYQRDAIVEHADETGDSLLLSRLAADSDAEWIVFCGVHFMAESADILTRDDQVVMMPNIRAGCSMADMADLPDVQHCWNELIDGFGLLDPAMRADPDEPAPPGEAYLVPVTYMNSSADLKGFVGEHGGIVCTSTNAPGVMKWALKRAGVGGKVLFFPDQHLGRNTALRMGYKESDTAVWNPMFESDWDGLRDATFVLWHGYCSVHQRFTTEQIDALREAEPQALIVVHPECERDVVDAADHVGSTEGIRKFCQDAPAGSVIGVGTEVHLVRRLDSEHIDKDIRCLDPGVCPCSTMYMIHPSYLADLLENIIKGELTNRIEVPEQVAHDAVLALDRMLDIDA